MAYHSQGDLSLGWLGGADGMFNHIVESLSALGVLNQIPTQAPPLQQGPMGGMHPSMMQMQVQPPQQPPQPPVDGEEADTIEKLALYVARNGIQFEQVPRSDCLDEF